MRFIKNNFAENRLKLVDMIAYHNWQNLIFSGVRFFNLMRGLTSTGFILPRLVLKTLGTWNQPNFWDGVPQDVLDKHGVSYMTGKSIWQIK
jgi:hypothetical protein